ncbi:iron chelate uptake ABC transporter family permease subunit [Thermococcus aggregans]|uniref:Iron chelate uptake ABC transporter family permease subunit n=1 Tax=Thermococcus aggregans TaxID=110163 RepID=A0A9E7MZ94_THEAG|nr:iron chelate uptake ABC transporter family permease subunit [Thermococcus aggregans]USS41466.1 iron chelate uptake ABC transporter family permease subunit [Thermococcus aggregans]
MKKIAGLVILSAVLILLGIAIGPVEIPFRDILGAFSWGTLKRAFSNPDSLRGNSYIVLQIRLPRVILAYLVGVSLASAGTASQALFKNPLADPYIIGISGGAAVGASIAALYFPQYMGFFALLGALLAVVVVYRIAKVNGHIPVDTLLLAGIALGFFTNALTSYLIYVGRERIHNAIFWLMGTFNGADWGDVKLVLLPSILGVGVLLFSWRELNLLLLGEESIAMGLDINLYRKIVIGIISLLTSFAVATSGIIGFVGLISPHAMRMLFGPNHKRLLPASALFGGALMVFADILARILLKPAEVPVGIITALFGAPFFIYLLMKKKRGELFG